MTQVKRWDIQRDWMAEFPEGRYVLWEDVKDLLAEASAPAVEQQPMAEVVWNGGKLFCMLTDWDEIPVGTKVYATPQAADTDKMREALSELYHALHDVLPAGAGQRMQKTGKWLGDSPYALRGHTGEVKFRADDMASVYAAMDQANAILDASTAAQAPVREVPGYKLVPIEPTEDMLAEFKEFIRTGRHYMDVSIWKAMLAAAPLPAAPVQQEGE